MNKVDLVHKWYSVNHADWLLPCSKEHFREMYLLIPNNYKKRYGFPTTRTTGKKKRHQKLYMSRKFYFSDAVFVAMMKQIDDACSTNIDGHFDNFIDIHDIHIGDIERDKLKNYVSTIGCDYNTFWHIGFLIFSKVSSALIRLLGHCFLCAYDKCYKF